MPIIGLTDRGPSFPRIGELRKGGEKPATGNKPGADLKHFRFTSQHADVIGMFAAAYGNAPTAVNCYLPFQTASENFEAWIEEWGAGSLKWRGDGKNLVIWQTPDGKYSQEPKPQPANGGKQVGRLKIIIPELKRLAYVIALTTGINDIMSMSATLEAYEAMRGDLRGIPFILSRVPRMVSTPGTDGKRARREKWLWHLEAQPVWVQAQLSVMQRAALPTVIEGQYQLSSGLVDIETGEIVDDDDDDFDMPALPEPKAAAPTPKAPPKPAPALQPTKAMFNKLHAIGVQKFGPEWDDARHELIGKLTDGRTQSSKQLTYEEVVKLAEQVKGFADFVEEEPLFDEVGGVEA
jgi:hypothetical protein